MPDPGPRLFVYGTLMPGESRWPMLLRYAVRWVPATASGHLWDTGRGYPAIRFDEEGEAVPGYAVTLRDEGWLEAVARLDRIEGEGALYRRVTVATSVGPALSYEWLGATEGLVRLPAGWSFRLAGGG